MPLIATKYFGQASYDPVDVFRFPDGVPGFEDEKSFLLFSIPDKQPLSFLQSLRTPDLCFVCLPVLAVDPAYQIGVSFEDLSNLDLDTSRQPRIGTEVLVLALLSIPEHGPATANLMAPIVINLLNQVGVQAIRSDFKYSHQQHIQGLPQEARC